MLSSGHEFDSCRHVKSGRRSLSSRTESASDGAGGAANLYTHRSADRCDRSSFRFQTKEGDRRRAHTRLLILDLTSEIISGSLSGKVAAEVQTSQVK